MCAAFMCTFSQLKSYVYRISLLNDVFHMFLLFSAEKKESGPTLVVPPVVSAVRKRVSPNPSPGSSLKTPSKKV
jgi:hypothetical protein